MTAKRKNWILQGHEDETFDVLRAGRRVLHHQAWDSAMEYLKKNKNPDDIVWHEAPDGYRTKLSGRGSRRKKS